MKTPSFSRVAESDFRRPGNPSCGAKSGGGARQARFSPGCVPSPFRAGAIALGDRLAVVGAGIEAGRYTANRCGRRGFTLLELLVVLAIIAVLAAVLFPVVGRMMERGRTTKCTNHLQQIGAAALRYAAENEMQLPVTSHQRRSGYKSWTVSLQPYASGKLFFRCPCDEDKERPYSYAMNDFLTPNPAGAPELDVARLQRLDRARETVLFAEASKEYVNTDHFHFSDYLGRPIPGEIFTKQVAAERHENAANYLFADGHVETIPWERAKKLLAQEGSRFFDPTIEDPAPETK